MSENRVFTFTVISALCLTLATTVYNYRQINEFENKYNATVSSASSSNLLNPANKINLEELKNLRDRIKSLHHETLTLFDKFNSAVLDANHGSSSDAQARLTQINKQLDENLKQVEIDFGMKTTRVSRLFQIYKHNYLKNYFTLPKDAQNEYQINLFTISEKLLNAEQTDINDFDVFMASVFLDNRKQYFPDADLIKRISSNIDNKFISSAIDKLKANRLNINNCVFTDGEENSYPSFVALNISELQYESRYCPVLVGTIPNETCFRARYSPSESVNAFCNIVVTRLQEEINLASGKYGALSFSQYFEKFVKPLVPAYVAEFNKESAFDKIMNCKISRLPIVKFRDPQVDASLAAYLEFASIQCKDEFFKET